MMHSKGRLPSVSTPIAVAVSAMMMLSMVTVPSVVMADEEATQDEGLQFLRTANDAFDDQDFERAYEYYVQAFDVLEIPQIKYRMGQTAAEIGEVELAVEHYEAYQEIGDDEEFLGRIEDALPELREQLKATVEIVTDPEGAVVSIRGADDQRQELGASPQTYQGEAGVIEIEVELDGYLDYATETTVEAGETREVDVELQRESVGDDEPQTVDMTPPADIDERDANYARWGWTSTAIGASILAVGGVMSYFQVDTARQVNDFDRSEVLADGGDNPEAWNAARSQQRSLRNDALNYHRTAIGAYIAGGLLTATGMGLLGYDAFFRDETDDEGLVEVRGGIDADGGFVGVGGRF